MCDKENNDLDFYDPDDMLGRGANKMKRLETNKSDLCSDTTRDTVDAQTGEKPRPLDNWDLL